MAVADRCSLRSRARGEPLAGTASTIHTWLLVEHPGPWGVDALRDARMTDRVGRSLRRIERESEARVLLIRRVDRRSDGSVTCFAVDTRDAWAGRRRLETIEDVGEIHLSDRATFEPLRDPIAVVCTHGRRDPCCAERGRPLAQALAASFPEATWESTHVGGDRFAGNLVLFPHGLYYGRVEPESAAGIVDAYLEGRVVLDNYRGRSRDPFAVQAAEHHLRTRLGIDGIDAITSEHVDREGRTVRVRFATPVGPHIVSIERLDTEPMRLTCHAEGEQRPLAWRPLEIDPELGR